MHWIKYCVIGLLAGLLSGFFGIGGGILIVPLLMTFLKFPRKLASGTSLLAIAPISIFGLASYAYSGNIDWMAGICVAVGAIAGGQIGSRLLVKVPTKIIAWVFIGALVLTAVQLITTIPERNQSFDITIATGALLVLCGLFAGVLSGLVGVGGGIIIVPALILFFGISDLAAKGASFLAIAPTAITTSITNARTRNLVLPAGITIGLSGVLATFVGAHFAQTMDAGLATTLFAILLFLVAIQNIFKQLQRRKS